MKILAVDQATNGGWSVFDLTTKELLASGEFSFKHLKDYPDIMVGIEDTVLKVAQEHEVGMVVIEDTNYRANLNTYKKLCWLQGALIMMCEKNGYEFRLVYPTSWQTYITKQNCDDVLSQEIKSKVKESKQISLNFIKYTYGIETDNDNLADAICIGYYFVNNGGKKIADK